MLELAWASLVVTVAFCFVVGLAIAIMIAVLHFGGLYAYFGLAFLFLWGIVFLGKVAASAWSEGEDDA